MLSTVFRGLKHKCQRGLIAEVTAKSDIIMQISKMYPYITFEFSSEIVDETNPNGLMDFKVKNGKILG
ncbi:MAG: hypothetical protein LBP40_03495 [Campylobacteraceae bacterium]|nr:hypothetical protein [Campylobacteraceae bacterium]